MRKHYDRPNIQVVKLQQQGHLLVDSSTSGLKGEISGYKNDGGGFTQEDD